MRGGFISSTTIGHTIDFDPTSKAHVAPPPSSFIIFITTNTKDEMLDQETKRDCQIMIIRVLPWIPQFVSAYQHA